MGINNKIAQYKTFKGGVCHCTFDPDGPGVVRIHLVPPKFSLFKSNPYVVILNGYYILPIGYSWAIALSSFMKEVNRFDGKPITDEDEKAIIKNTVSAVHTVYPAVSRAEIEEDVYEIMRVLFAVATRNTDEIEIDKLSLHAYADKMTAPHRFDLMVSAMTDESGRWQCNQKCRFCYAAGQCKSSSRELGTEEWKRAIDKLWDARVPMLTFTGGEPTMREDIDVLVGYAKRFITRLNTNGVRLTPELAARLREAGLDSVQITLYSHDEEIHNDLVGCAHFADTVNGIKNAVAAGLDVSVNTPLCKKNADYESTVAYVRSLGVRFVTASGLICTGMAGVNHEEYDLSTEELSAIIASAKKYCNGEEMEIDFTSPGLIPREVLEELGMNVPMCGAALSNMAIAPDGTVVPCQSWLGADADLGNILTDSFKKIWKHKKCRFLRRMTEKEALSCPFRSRKEDEK